MIFHTVINFYIFGIGIAFGMAFIKGPIKKWALFPLLSILTAMIIAFSIGCCIAVWKLILR